MVTVAMFSFSLKRVHPFTQPLYVCFLSRWKLENVHPLPVDLNRSVDPASPSWSLPHQAYQKSSDEPT